MANHTFERAVARWLGELAGALISVMFPGGCRLCNEVLTHASRIPICETCLSSFSVVPPQHCSVCGEPWSESEAPALDSARDMQLCRECQKHTYTFDAARSYGVYQGNLVRAVLLLKYEQIEPLGRWFARRLEEVVKREGELLAADVVVPVPLHRGREKERGFNQVDLFARPLAKHLRLPYRDALLIRKHPRPEKHLLRNEERWEAVRGAFAMREGRRVSLAS